MDQFSVINRLRARFLETFGEKDQVYRVIRPYYGKLDNNSDYSSIVNNTNVTGINEIDIFYQDNLGNNMLEYLESPPITSNSMDTFISKNAVRRNYHRHNNLVDDKNLDLLKGCKSDCLHMITYKDRSGELENTKFKDDNPAIPLKNSRIEGAQKNYTRYDKSNENFVNSTQHDSLSSNEEFETYYNNEDSIYNYEDTVKSNDLRWKLNKKKSFRFKSMFNRSKKSTGKDSYIDDDENDSIKFSFYNSMNNESSVNHKNINSNVSRQSPSSSKNAIGKNLSNTRMGTARRKSIYSVNFDYDENIEDDEDEDEDEDETKKKNNFFNIEGINTITDKIIFTGMHDGKPSSYGTNNKNSGNTVSNSNINIPNAMSNTNHNNGFQNYSSISNSIGNHEDKKAITTNTDDMTNNNSNSNIIVPGNVSRFKAHFPQLSKGMILDSQRNISSRSESTSVLKNDSSEALKLKSGEVTEEDISDQYEITDIDSFINDRDLDDLHLMESNDIKDGLHHNSFAESELLPNKYGNDISNIPGNLMSTAETNYISDESSYGNSLLESDLSREFSDKKDSSTFFSDSLSLNSSIPHNTISSHSIPLSLEGYGTYRTKDNLSTSQILERSTLGGRYGKSIKNRGRKGSIISLRESIPRSVSNRRFSLVSSHVTRNLVTSKNRMRSTSSINVEKPALPVPSEDGIANIIFKSKTSSSKLETHKVMKKGSKYVNEKEEDNLFPIEKNTAYLKPQKFESHLTSLFKKNYVSEGGKTEMLDYFAFVSGDTVPPNESMKLDIYIQDSKKYKKNNFTTTVRRSATIFEVIGYILYLYSTKYLPKDMSKNELDMEEIINPNNFNLKIVDEDGEPFEDNFGKLNRSDQMCSVSDNEVVLCKASNEEVLANEKETPLPYKIDMKKGETRERNYSFASSASSNKNENTLNQLSFYKSIISKPEDLNSSTDKTKTVEITVYKYPNVNPKFNYTNIKVSVTASVNDILVKYCRLKDMDSNEYALKIIGKNCILDVNDTVLRLDGNYEVEIISKKEARMLQLEKIKPDLKKPKLPTIQSNDLTPLTLESASYMNKGGDNQKPVEEIKTTKITKGKNSSKHKLVSIKTNVYGGGSNGFGGTKGGSFTKNKNISKSSLQGTTDIFHHSNKSEDTLEYTPDSSTGNNYQDVFSGAYHKYKVWRRQQMSLINKHERTLALDGDYIYIVPPEGKMHWHENVKTKSFHINQVVLVKRSKKVPVNFKLYVQRGQDDIKRYYFEAVSPQECVEIVSRIHNLLTAYRMNHK